MQCRPPQRRVYPVVVGRVHTSQVECATFIKILYAPLGHLMRLIIIEVSFWSIIDIDVTLMKLYGWLASV